MKNLYVKLFCKRSLCTLLICVLLCTAVTAEIRSFAAQNGDLLTSDGERVALWSSIFGSFDGGSVTQTDAKSIANTATNDNNNLHESHGRTIIKFRIVEIFRK